MPNTARVSFSISNQAFTIAALLKGISFVEGKTIRGPVSNPKDIITNWPQFVRIFGGLTPGTDFPLLCKRALEYGAQLRVNRVLHYTDPADASTLSAVKATISAFTDGTDTLFTLTMKNAGLDYNNFRIEVYAASNGQTNYFNLKIYNPSDSGFTPEIYENLTIPGIPTVVQSHYLDEVIRRSEIVNVTYSDLSSLTAPLRPVDVVKTPSGGTDGGSVVVADYVGDSAGKTGLNAFDAYDDAMQMGAPEISTDTLHIAGAAYALNRADLMYFGHIDNSNNTATLINTERDSWNIDNIYSAFFGGGLKVLDPSYNVERNISELGDVFGLAAYSDNVAHEWYSFAGINRGVIRNAIGVVNNFGTPALQADLNLIANHQVNMVVANGGMIYLSGNFTATYSLSPTSFINAVRLLIFMKKSMGPLLKRYLEQPADIPTFKAIFRGVEPFLDMLVAQRALFSYVWDGDQFISKIEDVVVNNLTDLQNGKYKVKLYIKIIPSLQEIAVEIVITALSVDFTVLQQTSTN